MMKKLILASTSMALASGFAFAGDKIVGGSNVSPDQMDARQFSTVALTTDIQKSPDKPSPLAGEKSFCTGTIISERVIVTAAHCLQAFDPATRSKKPGIMLPEEKDFIVHFDTKVNKDGTFIRAEKVIPHPDWSPMATLNPFTDVAPNDIGIIVLSEDIPEKAKPVAIADLDLDLTSFKKAYLAGFGVSFNRNLNNTGVLRQVATSMGNSAPKLKKFGVGQLGKGACAGDSGGPAFIKNNDAFELVGATSTGIEILGTCIGVANNYTDVRYYKDWIEQYL